ncbi:MAG TPA: DUF4292 domain-containing protein, partial [Bacteroidales bacterium]|nr:DUF4292 domain-containing protein [Bacteroidales bacterium]
LLENNLVVQGFFIQKAEVEISGKDIHQKLLASIKFNPPDTYNISLRLRTGIEVARIFLTGDTVLANDRINRRLYKGKSSVLGRRYGIGIESLPLIFGDFHPSGKEQPTVKCENGLAEFRSFQHGMSLVYYADCNLAKVVKILQNSSLGSGGNEILFDDFIHTGDIVIPSDIRMSQPGQDISVRIRIVKIEKPWSGSAAFFPGNRYEVIELK